MLILAYHRVNPEIRDGLSISPSMLESQVSWLLERGWENVMLQEAVADTSFASGKKFVVTFDDGYRDNYHHAAPVLEGLGVKATVYLVSDMIDTDEPFPWVKPFWGHYDELDLHMTSKQILDMRERGTFSYGSHTLTHPFLSTLGDDRARAQIRDSKRSLEDLLQTDITSFCYPAGDFTDRTVELVGEEGYDTGVVTPNRQIAESRLTLHRVGVYSHITPRLFATKVNWLVRRAQHSKAFWWLRSRAPLPRSRPVGTTR